MSEKVNYTKNGCGLIAQSYDLIKVDGRSYRNIIDGIDAGESPAKLAVIGAAIALKIDDIRRLWQEECNVISRRDFGFDVFDSMDAYDLDRCAWIGISPDKFLRDRFHEDYERLKVVNSQGDEDVEK